MNLEVVSFMGLARQMDLWNSSVRCPRRMHLTSKLYREESHGAPVSAPRWGAHASSRAPGSRNRLEGEVWALPPPSYAREKPKVVITAIARELFGFIWRCGDSQLM
jgi:hypothetical protein